MIVNEQDNHEQNSIDPVKEPSLEQWKTLYDLAAELKKLAPWKSLRDHNLLMIELPKKDEPVFCSVMGGGSMTFGISVYPDYNSFFRLNQLLQAESHIDNMLQMMNQRCISCQFGDRDEIEPADRKIIKALGLRFRGQNQWTYFRSVNPGQFPWYLNADEADILIRTMEQLLPACRSYMNGEVSIDFEEQVMLRRYYSEEEDSWKMESFSTQNFQIPRSGIPLTLTDEVEMARLKKKKKTKAVLELATAYIPIPFRSKDGLIRTPHLAVLMDRNTETVIRQKIMSDPESSETVPADMLLDYVMDYGRPSALHVRTVQDAISLQDLCSELGIRLHAGGNMDLSNDLFFEFMCQLGQGLNEDFDDDEGEDDDDDDFFF